MQKQMKWTQEQIDFLIANYPSKGKMWCANALGRSEASIRQKASNLGLKQDDNGEFFQDWQNRAKTSKIGKKRPAQAEVMKKLHADGKLKMKESTKKKLSESTKKWIKEKGHPKGSLGMKHTEKTKQVLSEKSKQMWKDMPEDVRDAYSARASANGSKTAMNRATASWKAGWREIGGKKKYYRSRWEANYARYLEWLKKNKQIISWAHEPKTFWFEGIKRGVMSYLPDFCVINLDGSEEYHEVKGWMDDRSKTKIKRMAKYYPQVKLIVIDSKLYKSIEKKAKYLVKDWE